MTARAFQWVIRLLAVAAILPPVAGGHRADAASASAFLVGQVLVASPGMGDPRFARSVVYIVAHDGDGAMGLVLNRSLGEGSLKSLLQGFGVQNATADGVVRLQYGGPVARSRGFVLHAADFSGRATMVIGDGVALSTGFDVLKAVAAGEGPERRRFYLGYAGWGPGQLEGELARDDWLIAPADAALVFGDDLDGLWEKTMKHAGRTL
jgi:putative transcriptional regulator